MHLFCHRGQHIVCIYEVVFRSTLRQFVENSECLRLKMLHIRKKVFVMQIRNALHVYKDGKLGSLWII